jgi:hypothetical protein
LQLRGELAARWTATEIHIALTTPEEPGISRRNPMGIVRGSSAIEIATNRMTPGLRMAAFGPKAEVGWWPVNVRF